MKKRLKITENQFTKLKNILTESLYSDGFDLIAVGDLLKVVSNESVLFKVEQRIGNEIWFKNISDPKYKSLILYCTDKSFSNNILNLRFINPVKNKELVKDISKWQSYDIKNISEFLLIDGDNNKIKFDFTNLNNKSGRNKSNKNNNDDEIKLKKELINDFLYNKENDEFILTLDDNSKITFNVTYNKSSILGLEIVDTTGGESERYSSLKNKDLEFKPSIENIELLSTDDLKYNLIMNQLVGGVGDDDESAKMMKFNIDGVIEYEQTENIKNDDDSDINSMSNKEFTKMVLDDPLFRSAFMKSPTLFDAIRGSQPKGILRAKKILNSIGYHPNVKGDKKTWTNLFKNNDIISFNLLDKSFIHGDIKFELGSTYRLKVKVSNSLGNRTVILTNDIKKYYIEIKDKYLDGNKELQFRVRITAYPNTNSEASEDRIIQIINKK